MSLTSLSRCNNVMSLCMKDTTTTTFGFLTAPLGEVGLLCADRTWKVWRGCCSTITRYVDAAIVPLLRICIVFLVRLGLLSMVLWLTGWLVGWFGRVFIYHDI